MLELDYETGMMMLEEAYRTVQEEKLWDLYCTHYPNMTEETFMSFEKFKEYVTAPVVQHTKEQILGRVENILDNISFERIE